MYSGQNPKALLSVELLCQGLETELAKATYNSISIRDLCREADVSRQTFYNLFESKEEVLRYRINRIFRKILEERSHKNSMNALDSLKVFVEAFYENQAFMTLLTDNHLEDILVDVFMKALDDLLRMSKDKVELDHIDYIFAFYSGGLSKILFHWCKDPHRVSLETLTKILSENIELPYFQ